MPSNGPTLHQALNSLLSDSFVLYLESKGFHWHVASSHFREYYLLFDDQAIQVLATTDLIAERVRKTQGTTLGSIGDVARPQTLRDVVANELPAEAMFEALLNDNKALLLSIREVKRLAEAAGDNATSSLADDLTNRAEERSWFLSQTLEPASLQVDS